MEPSRFSELIAANFPGLILNWVEKVNGDDKPPVYYYDRWFRPEFSGTGDFSAVETDNSVPMAYIIDYDSPLPLIKGQAIKVYNGEIPKIGVEIQATEKQLTEMNNLTYRTDLIGANQLVRALFAPVKKVYLAQKERLEWMALQLISRGYAETSPLVNTGTNIRIDANYPTENLHNASVVWGQVGYTPLTDLEKVQAASNYTITKFLVDRPTFNLIRNSAEAKNLYNPLAAILPGLNEDQLNSIIQNQYGFTLEIVERQVTIQKNGVDTKLTPWVAGQVVGVISEILGAVVWAPLAEALDMAEGVNYETAEDMFLLRKFKVVHPAYGEFTSSQSRSACVLTQPSTMHKLDTTSIA